MTAATDRRAGAVAVLTVLGLVFGLAVWVASGTPAPAPPRRPVGDGAGADAGPPVPTSTATPTPTASAAAPFGDVDWSAVAYPLECGEGAADVQDLEVADVTGDGRPEAAVAVRCSGGAGTPPSALYVYVPADPATPAPAPRLLGTLLEPAADVLLTGVVVAAGAVSGTGTTYSSPQVPRCCPDRTFRRTWEWDGSRFVEAGDGRA